MTYAPGGWGAFLALSRDPANRSQWLAGADVGGLYVSVDDGVSWQSCNAGISTLWVMAIAFSQRGPQRPCRPGHRRTRMARSSRRM